MKKQLAVLAAAFGMLMTIGAQAPGGRLHPALEQKLKILAPGEKLAVIVELDEQARPAAIISAMRGAGRGDRARAVIGALRDVAARRQGPLLAHLKEKVQLGAAERVRPFWIFDGLAVTAPEELIRELASRPDVREVRLDARIPLPSLYRVAAGGAAAGEWNIETVRAPEVWALDAAHNGAGAVVGSFDTGVDRTHPDLFARYRGNHAISWFDPYGEHAVPYDFHGHGTHTTGTAVGGDASGSSIGVAPGAAWIAAKGWNDAGVGLASAFHEIFEWFLAPGGDPDSAPDVVNCSWAFDEAGCDEEFRPDIEAWRAAGIFPAFAAGNDGPGAGSVRSPATYAVSFAVGATDIADAIADFSGQGPSPCDGSVKPDLSAPGDGILSAVPMGYDIMSGTSMAAPHVAGAVAVLRSIDPTLTVDQLESLLKAGAKDIAEPGDDNSSGAGRLDLFVSAEIAILGPDTPVVKVLATDAVATEAGPTPGTFVISRTGDTSSDLEVHFMVGGTATSASDYASIGESLILPAGQASAEIAVTALDDALPEQPETVILTISPDPGYIVSGSGAATVTIQSDELLSDLAVSAFSVPAGSGAGESVALTDTTRNQGAGAADPSVTQFYLSANSAYDGSDILLGGRAVAGLAAGATSSGSTTVTIPAGTAAGTWSIIALADGEGTIPESSETNNGLARSIKIGPDLAVTTMTVPTTTAAGLSISITDTTKNLGGGAAAGSLTQYFLSPNSTLDASDVRLGARSVEGLAAGMSSAGSSTVTIPSDTAAGLWYVIAKADGEEAVPETSETNNILARSIKIGPDLDVTSFTAPSTAGAGLAISISDTTKNLGGGAAAASLTQFFLSSDSALGASDTLLGARSVPGLAAGATSSGSAGVTIPDGTAIGTWFLIAKADGPEAVTETSESNNTSVKSISIGPDLAVSAITAPTTSGAGQTITVTDTTKNQGGGTAAASRTQIYLSANTAVDEDDTVLGARNVVALGGGMTSSGSVSVTIPSGTSVGTWYILAKADCDGAVAETAETNNSMARSIKIGPDLVISAISAPTASGPGQAITVTDSTKNQGGGAAAAFRTRLFLSSDSTFGTSDIDLGGRDIGGLAAGATDTGSTTVTIPEGTAVGTWYLIAKADADGAVPETAETNNAYPKAITIGPDLDITAIAAPSTAAAGQAIVVTDTVKNIGGGTAGSTQTYFYLSTNSSLDAADILLGVRDVPGLAAGATGSGSVTVVVPAGTAAGTWYLIGKTDGAGIVAETSESNNTFPRSLKVT